MEFICCKSGPKNNSALIESKSCLGSSQAVLLLFLYNTCFFSPFSIYVWVYTKRQGKSSYSKSEGINLLTLTGAQFDALHGKTHQSSHISQRHILVLP